jgi:EAL domain-containing protein (putative c-di-GMP-specific phosphodiesterase class I)
VSDVGKDGDDVLVQSIIDLRHNIGLPVLAEGVDSEDTLNALISLGCDVAPGCHFAPPPDQLWRRVRERRPALAAAR